MSARSPRGSDPARPAVEIRLLGVCEWHSAAGRDGLSAKDAALIALLALDGPQARLELCQLMWPDSTPHKGHANLRSRAHRLHAATSVPVIEVADPVRLSDGVEVDTGMIGAMDVTALLAAGPLLAGVDLGDHGELDRWIADARRRVAEDCAHAFATRADALERDGNLHDALLLARRATELTPLSEACWYRLMQFHYLRNDRAAAQEAFWRFSGLLRDELGIRPSASMLELMQTIEVAERSPVSRHRPVPASVLRPPTMIGRDQPWQAMWSAWQKQHPFIVWAEAGLGKTRLLAEYCRGMAGVLLENALPGDEPEPYGLLGRLLVAVERQFAPVLEDADRAELARVRSELGTRAVAPPHTSVIERAVENMLAAASANGLGAIVLDDIHHADAPTLQVLRRLGSRPRLRAVRLGLASRPAVPEPAGTLLRDWQEDSHRLVGLELQPLTRAEVAALLSSLMLSDVDVGELADRVFDHAGGHPLYTLATLHAAFADGVSLAEDRLPRPVSIQALLDARISDLPAHAVPLLQAAAVAGRDLSAERAARMLGCRVLDLAQAWASLEAADVLRGESFSHALVHDAALRTVPEGIRQALHRQFADTLGAEPDASKARLAWHWEQGQRWQEAGHGWRRAAQGAAATGLLEQQSELLLRAALCHERAGDNAARFDALCDRLEGMQLRPGGAAVLAALPEVEALADTQMRRLRCQLARAEALLGIECYADAAAEASRAVDAAESHPAPQTDARAIQAQALAQCGQFDAAQHAATLAMTAARDGGDPWQTLRVMQASSFVAYSAGQIGDALRYQREAVALAERIGHRYEAAAGAGHVAALLAIVGDVPGSHEQARSAAVWHRHVGIDADSTHGSVNDRVLGAAAAARGRFDEALECMQRAVKAAGPHAAPGARTKAQLGLASIWLSLGRFDRARAVVEEIAHDPEPSRQAQAHWVLARAAEGFGEPAQHHWTAIARLATQHAEVPLMRSFWFEWSYQGDATDVIERMRRVRAECEAKELTGTARMFAWRELARWLDVPGPAAVVAGIELAGQLAPHVEHGLNARCLPTAVWHDLARAYARADDVAARAACLAAGAAWVDAALPHVPDDCRDSFLHANPPHRMLGEPP